MAARKPAAASASANSPAKRAKRSKRTTRAREESEVQAEVFASFHEAALSVYFRMCARQDNPSASAAEQRQAAAAAFANALSGQSTTKPELQPELQLVRGPVRGDVRGKSCSTCMEPLEAGQEFAAGFCLHHMHAKCLNTWAEQKRECPVCREPF